jgi:hypothetical protein
VQLGKTTGTANKGEVVWELVGPNTSFTITCQPDEMTQWTTAIQKLLAERSLGTPTTNARPQLADVMLTPIFLLFNNSARLPRGRLRLRGGHLRGPVDDRQGSYSESDWTSN